jgi:hypothetical protein
MDSKRLIIVFFTVSLAAIAVSFAAVITAGRAYSRMLCEASVTSPPEITSAEVTHPYTPESELISDPTVTEADLTVSLPEATEAEASAEESTAESAGTEGNDRLSLVLSEGRLVILSPEGEKLYERITDVSRLHPKDIESLAEGLSFDTREEAMSAIYDLIS